MPEFEVLPKQDAMLKSSTGRRAQILREYVQYINRLGTDEAGKISPSSGESVATVRRRLGAAARSLGKNMQIKRIGQEIYFWEDTPRRRGGRPRKNAAP